MKSIISLLVLALLPGVAFAKSGGGAGAGAANLKSGNSMYGLCSQDLVNVDTDWTSGPKDARNGKGASWCQDIEETLDNQKGCSINLPRPGKNKLDPNQTIADQLAKNDGLVKSLEEACGPKIQQIKSDPTKFKLFLKQLFAVLFIQENEWKSEPTSYMGAQGLGQLDAKSVKAYGKCNPACSDISKTGTKGGANHIGDHNNVKCAVTIGLFYMGIDGVMGEGSGNKGSKGIARYFQPFRNIDRKNRNGWMMPKLKKYCNERIDQESGGGGKSEGSGTTTTFIDYWNFINNV